MPMKPLENKPGMGVLFWRQADGNKPTLTGGCNIDGVEYEISGWERTSKNNKEYVSLSVKPARKAEETRGRWQP